MATTKHFSAEEVAKHSSQSDLYIVIHSKVYDCTEFANEHPGGAEVLSELGGQDATDAFEDVGHSDEARELLKRLVVGKCDHTGATGIKGDITFTPKRSSRLGWVGILVVVICIILVLEVVYSYF